MIVLDASAGVELLRWSAPGRRVGRAMSDDSETVHVPHLFAMEVMQVVRRLAASGAMTATRAGQAVLDLSDLDLVRHDHEPFLNRVWSLRHELTAYDAVYVALAEALDAPLVTLDQRLAASARGTVRVELLAPAEH